jgi:hypothetical protein
LYSGVNALFFLRAIDNSWRILALSGVSTEAGDDHTDIIGSNALSIAGPVCMNNATSTGLASMAATWVKNEPGKCKPTGGDLVGNVVARQASLFCCQPLP